jgi:23S rRNA (pseudouridine1915-N3)-methyltransferase
VRIVIVAVGRLRRGPAQELIDTYKTRMSWPLELKEVQEKRASPPAGLKAAEASLLLQALPESGPVIALDERGDDLSSNAFAELLSLWRDNGESTCGFAIGGADGLDESVRKRATKVVRFGRQTWPHMLARVMLVEQLYRAQQILAGHPYHRE